MEKEELLQRINKSVPLMAELAKAENVISDYPKVKSKAYKWIMLSLWPAFLGILFLVGFLTATEDKLKFFLITLILFVPTTLAIVAFIKKKQKYDEAVKKSKDIENDPTLSWLPISYRNSYAFSYISDYITSGRADTLKEALNDFEAYQKNLLLAASLNRPLS